MSNRIIDERSHIWAVSYKLPAIKTYLRRFLIATVAYVVLISIDGTLFRTDEFQRSIFAQSMQGGVGGLLAITSVWGMLECYTHVSHLQPVWIFPIFWVFVSTPILNWRYR